MIQTSSRIFSHLVQSKVTQIGNDPRVNRILQKIQVITVVTSSILMIYAFLIKDLTTLKLSAYTVGIFLVFYLLTKKGNVKSGAFLSSLYLVSLVSYAMLTGTEGIRDEIILVLPAFFLLGSLFLNDILFFLLVLLSLLSITIIGYFQLNDSSLFRNSDNFKWNDIIVTVVILGGVALIMRSIAGNLLNILSSAIKSEKNYKEIFNASNEAIFIHRMEDGKIMDVNDSMLKIYGYSRDEILNKDPKDYDLASGIGVYNNKNIMQWIQKAITEGPQLFEWQAKKKDGAVFWVEVSLSYSDNRVIAVVRDIDEKKKIEAELTQRDKMRAVGQLAGGIAHDFNNQLSGIMGFAEVIKMECKDDSIQEYANHIVSSAEASTHQIKQLLSFARKSKNEFLTVNVNDLLKQVVSILEKSIDKKIDLQVKLSDYPLWVKCDTAQIENAFLNLALNARDAMPDGGVLTIQSDVTSIGENFSEIYGYRLDEGQYVNVLVSDTGTGISSDIKEKIFEPFFTTKDSGKGTGMGLSAVYGAIKGHLGAINLTTKKNEGSTFQVLLPYNEVEQMSLLENDEQSVSNDQTFKGEGTVFVVDDEPSVRALAKKHLSDFGYNVRLFEDGIEAIDEFKKIPEDVKFILLDMIMPQMSGEEVFRELKNINPDVCVIIVSGYSLNQDSESLLEQGALGFIQKPYKRSELVDILNKI